MQRLLVQNNLYLLKKYEHLRTDHLFYAPIYHTSVQYEFYQRRFQELKKLVPKATWCEYAEDRDFDVALSWDAEYEQRAFGAKIYPEQNRLLSDLPFDLPPTFTPFWKKLEPLLPESYPEAISPWDGDVITELDFYFRKTTLPQTYAETRNEMTGRNGSSKFSSFLSSGVLDVRHLYNEIKAFEKIHGKSESTKALIYELVWREYFYWHYHEHPREYFSKNGLKGELDFSPVKEYFIDELRQLTDDAFFLSALSELSQTGFLSNRTRQLFASFWINELKLDWRSGALLFEHHLIDYDVYSNSGNWMYLAGVGVDPRGKRIFNIAQQLETYDPEQKYLRTWHHDCSI